MSNHSCFVKGLPDRARNGGNLGRRPRLDLNFNSTSFGRINAKPPSNKGWVASVLPIREAIAQETKTPLLILFATVFFVLLLVCANVAGLQLARASSRANEMAVRTSLGATSLRITCQILIESLLLSLTGGALGLLFAQWLVDGLRSAAPEDLAFDATLHRDTTVLTDVCIPAHDRMRLERLCRMPAAHRWLPSGCRCCPTAGCCIASSAAGATAPAT